MKRSNRMSRQAGFRLAAVLSMFIVGSALSYWWVAPAAAAGTIEVSASTQLTMGAAYDRNPSFLKSADGTYWLFFTRSTTEPCVRPACNADLQTYNVFYMTSADGVAWSSPMQLSDRTGITGTFYGRTVAATQAADGTLWVFWASGGNGHQLFYYTNSGSGWSPRQELPEQNYFNVEAVSTADGDVWVFFEDCCAPAPGIYSRVYDTTDGWSTPTLIAADMSIPKAIVDGGGFHVVMVNGAGENFIMSSTDGGATWSTPASIAAPSGSTTNWDPTIFKDAAGKYNLFYAPDLGSGVQQIGWKQSPDAADWSGASAPVTAGAYASNSWWDYWPEAGQVGSDTYLFYTSEKNGPSLGNGHIWMTKVDWAAGTPHFEAVLPALAAASDGDTINVAPGNYPGAINITQDSLSLIGAGSGLVTLDVSTGGSVNDAAVNIVGAGVTLQGVTVNGTGPVAGARYGVRVNQVSVPVTLSDVKVQNMYRTGIDLNGSVDAILTDVQAINNGGAGISLSDVKGATLTNITTSGNPWGGVGIFNFGRYYPIGNEDIVFAGTNSFGESGDKNGGLYLESADFANPGTPDLITWSTTPGVADVTLQPSDFGFVLQGNHELQQPVSGGGDYTFNYERFYSTEAQALSAAVGTPDHFLAAGRFVHDVASLNYFVAPGMSIQAAINAATDNDTVNVRAGTFTEALVVSTPINLMGAGIDNSFIVGPTNQANTVLLGAGVLMDGFTVTRAGNTVAEWIGNQASQGVSFAQTSGASTLQNTKVTEHRNGVYLNNSQNKTVQNNIITNNRTGVQVNNNMTGLVITGNEITNNWTVGLLFNADSLTAPTTNIEVHNNVISGNWYGGIVSRFTLAPGPFDVENNYYGQAVPSTSTANSAEPGYDNQIPVAYGGTATPPASGAPDILGPTVSKLDYSPWCTNAACTTFASTNEEGEIIVAPGATQAETQAIIDSAPDGATIVLPPGVIVVAGGFNLANNNVTLVLSPGTLIQANSPCFAVAANDITIVADPIGSASCSPSAADHGVDVTAAVSNLTIQGLEFIGSATTGDAIHLGFDVNGLKIVDNYIHGFAGDGIEYAASTTVSGVHRVQGNLFLSNGLAINNGSGNVYNVEYNAFGTLAAPAVAAANGISANLDADPNTQAALSAISSGSPVADKVAVGAQITYTVQIEAAQLHAADFDVSFDKTKLQVVSLTNSGAFVPAASCALNSVVDANATGSLSFCGQSNAGVNGAAVDVFTVVFQGLAAGTTSLDFDASDDVFAMAPPAGDSNNVFASALNDQTLEVFAAFSLSGTIDLQGRANDSGAQLTFQPGASQGYGPYAFSLSTNFGAISASNVVADSYTILVAMDRYLDVTLASNKSFTVDGLTTALNSLTLLGGDVDDNDVINIGDASLIGGQYGNSGASITVPGADINNDGTVSIFDLVLVGGNLDKTPADYSWIP